MNVQFPFQPVPPLVVPDSKPSLAIVPPGVGEGLGDGEGVGVGPPPLHDAPTPLIAAQRSSRRFVIGGEGRVSVICGPLPVRAATRWSADEPGFACASTATAPATWGVACDVPPIVMPAAVIIAPGASMSSEFAVWEKQVILSAFVLASVHSFG